MEINQLNVRIVYYRKRHNLIESIQFHRITMLIKRRNNLCRRTLNVTNQTNFQFNSIAE